MCRKYRFMEENIKINGHKLYRIKALRDFRNIKKGDIGGFVEKEDNLSQKGDCWVYDNAIVYDCARVYENAMVYGDAKVFGNAEIYGHAMVYGDAKVFGNAEIYGYAKVHDYTEVFSNAEIYGNARINGFIKIYGNSKIHGKITSISSNYCKIYGDTEIGGKDFINIENDADIIINGYIKSNNDWCSISSFGNPYSFLTFFRCRDNKIRVTIRYNDFYGTIEEFTDMIIKNLGVNKTSEKYLNLANLMKIRFNETSNKVFDEYEINKMKSFYLKENIIRTLKESKRYHNVLKILQELKETNESLVENEANALIDFLKDDHELYQLNELYQVVKEKRNMLLHEYAINVTHRKRKDNIDIDSLRSFEILESLLYYLISEDRDSVGWVVLDVLKNLKEDE